MQDQIKEEILSYEKLSHKWDMGEGIPPDEIVVKRALKIYDFGKNLQFDVEPHPLSNGGIMLTFYKDEYFLDVSIFYSNTELHYEIGKGYNFTSEELKYLNDQTIIDKLLEINEHLCQNSLEHYTPSIIIKQSSGLTSSRYSQFIKEEYHYSGSIARLKLQMVTSAGTLVDSMQPQWATQ